MERGYGSDSGRINHEIGYGSELVGGTIGGYASGSGSGVVGRNDFKIGYCYDSISFVFKLFPW